jgi:uncharacterized protein YbjT (DUF2867 family)
MAILVTGSTGTIGSQVLSQLQGKAADVRALTRSPEKAQVPAGVTPVKGGTGRHRFCASGALRSQGPRSTLIP